MLIPGMAADVSISTEPKKVTYNTPSTVSVTSTASEVLAENTVRAMALFVNKDIGKTIYLRIGGVPTVGEGIPISPRGGAYQMSLDEHTLSTEAVQAIVASGTADMLIIECETVV